MFSAIYTPIFPNNYFPYPGEETVNSIQFECNLSGS